MTFEQGWEKGEGSCWKEREREKDRCGTISVMQTAQNDATQLPMEVWYVVLRRKTDPSMWQMCRMVCRLWREIVPPIAPRSKKGATAQRLVLECRRMLANRLGAKGWLQCLRYLDEETGGAFASGNADVFLHALKGGHMEVCEWMVESKGLPKSRLDADLCIRHAALSKRADALEWFGRIVPGLGLDPPTVATSEVVESLPLEFLRRIRDKGFWSPIFAWHVCMFSAEGGRLDVLDWLRDEKVDVRGAWESVAMIGASAGGNLAAVEWLLRNVEQAGWYPVMSHEDARMRHPQIFEWAVLREAYVSAGVDLMATAAFHGNLGSMLWLERAGRASATDLAANAALLSGGADVLAWLHERGAQPDPGCWTRILTLYDRPSCRISETERVHRVRTVAWLLDTQVGMTREDAFHACRCAAVLGSVDLIERVLDKGFLSERPSGFADYVVHAAAEHGRVGAMQHLCDNIALSEHNRVTMMERAIAYGRTEAVAWMIEAGFPHSHGMAIEIDMALRHGFVKLAAWMDQRFGPSPSPLSPSPSPSPPGLRHWW